MKWIAIAVLLVFMPPLLILCYMTIILGGGYTDKQWEVARDMAIFGGLLEVTVLGVWAAMIDAKWLK